MHVAPSAVSLQKNQWTHLGRPELETPAVFAFLLDNTFGLELLQLLGLDPQKPGVDFPVLLAHSRGRHLSVSRRLGHLEY
jgi:hypothetical protein